MLNLSNLKKYYKDKKVLMTGHTGFKGSYMCVLLNYLGAKVYGYSLKPEKNGLYELITNGYKKSRKIKNVKNHLVCDEIFADIRDVKKLTAYIKKVRPDYILHMAAQPLVLAGYEMPRYTYEVNVMGTVNLFEAIREIYKISNIKKSSDKFNPISILNVTTDKVYENNDKDNYQFKEIDKLCGRDPYANSKSCSELVTYAYEKSFFNDKNYFRVSTARAGNVIGGGDLNRDRIIPDCYRAIKNKKDMFIRNPYSIRPYQYVMEPLIIYLNIMAYQLKNKKYEGNYNIGPDKKDCIYTKVLVDKFYDEWQRQFGKINSKIKSLSDKKNTAKKHEANFLRLDNSLIKKIFDYKIIFDMNDAMRYTVKVYNDMLNNDNIYESIIDVIEKSKF